MIAAPAAPTSLTATADGQTIITLSWTVPSDNGGAAIIGYQIEVSPTGIGDTWTNLVDNTESTTTTYAHTGLSAGTTRHYRVRAINSVGAGSASNPASTTTSAPTVATAPGAPTSLTATASGETTINLSWTAPTNTGGAAITGYKIEDSTDGNTFTELVESPSNPPLRAHRSSRSHDALLSGPCDQLGRIIRSMVECGQCDHGGCGKPGGTRRPNVPHRHRLWANDYQSIVDGTRQQWGRSDYRIYVGSIHRWGDDLHTIGGESVGNHLCAHRTFGRSDAALPGPCDQLGRARPRI